MFWLNYYWNSCDWLELHRVLAQLARMSYEQIMLILWSMEEDEEE
jgi:hypothetical protein